MRSQSPGCKDADDVHDEPSPDHVPGAQAARPITDGVRPRGNRQHEGVTHTNLAEKSVKSDVIWHFSKTLKLQALGYMMVFDFVKILGHGGQFKKATLKNTFVKSLRPEMKIFQNSKA